MAYVNRPIICKAVNVEDTPDSLTKGNLNGMQDFATYMLNNFLHLQDILTKKTAKAIMDKVQFPIIHPQ